jgi:hypothetical protein
MHTFTPSLFFIIFRDRVLFSVRIRNFKLLKPPEFRTIKSGSWFFLICISYIHLRKSCWEVVLLDRPEEFQNCFTLEMFPQIIFVQFVWRYWMILFNGHLNCKECWNDLILSGSRSCALCRAEVMNLSKCPPCEMWLFWPYKRKSKWLSIDKNAVWTWTKTMWVFVFEMYSSRMPSKS